MTPPPAWEWMLVLHWGLRKALVRRQPSLEGGPLEQGLRVVPVHLLGVMGSRPLLDGVSKTDKIPSETPTVVPRPPQASQEDGPALPRARGSLFSCNYVPVLSGQLDGLHRHSHIHALRVCQASAILTFWVLSVQR